MGIEIERKFLVIGDEWRQPDAVFYSQGYLNRDKERTVRVRIANQTGYLTIKGKSEGATRVECEYEIPLQDAQQLLALCEKPLIEKYRHKVIVAGHVWEVDEFLGENAGLIVAEIELNYEDEQFETPRWIGMEVTQDARYFNSNLSINPFKTWQLE